MFEDAIKVKLYTPNVEIEVVRKKGISEQEAKLEAILALIGAMDVKQFVENGCHELFDQYMERILEAIHSNCEWAGWQEH